MRVSLILLCAPALQTQSTLHEVTAPGNEACGWAHAADSGFVVRADALRLVRWLPEHSEAIGHALGKELPRWGGSRTSDTFAYEIAKPDLRIIVKSAHNAAARAL
jgi:hypothetical protein